MIRVYGCSQEETCVGSIHVESEDCCHADRITMGRLAT